jgi:hypothetical protein
VITDALFNLRLDRGATTGVADFVAALALIRAMPALARTWIAELANSPNTPD